MEDIENNCEVNKNKNYVPGYGYLQNEKIKSERKTENKEIKNEKPEISERPEITLVIQFLHLGGSLARA